MSRSDATVRVQLTAEQRAARAKRRHIERFSADVRGEMKQHVLARARQQRLAASAPAERLEALTQRLETASSIAELRSMHLSFQQTDFDPALDPRHATVIALEFDLAAASAELESMRRVAKELEIDVPENIATEVNTIRALATASPDMATRRLGALATRIAELDGLINDALDAEDAKAAALDIANEVLRRSGFTTATSTSVPNKLTATSSTGQTVSIEAITDGGETKISTSVIDPESSLPAEHSQAGDVCEPAVLTQFELQKAFTNGLETGRPKPSGHPTRGAGAARTFIPPSHKNQAREAR